MEPLLTSSFPRAWIYGMLRCLFFRHFKRLYDANEKCFSCARLAVSLARMIQTHTGAHLVVMIWCIHDENLFCTSNDFHARWASHHLMPFCVLPKRMRGTARSERANKIIHVCWMSTSKHHHFITKTVINKD